MDSGQMPQVQPLGPAQPVQPAQPLQSISSLQGVGPDGLPTANGMAMVQQAQIPPEPKKDVAGLVKTIAIIVVSLVALTFIGLFIWMRLQYDEVQTDVQGQIDVAVAAAKDEQSLKMEAEFLEREKYPYKTFSGPIDYGELSFEYPRTWSVYVAAAAEKGGDFNAYFNPEQVDAVGIDTINALRVTILNESFDDVVAEYARIMERKNSGLTVQSVTFGRDNNIIGNRYTGIIPNTDLNGYIVVFKIRDKTVILQTDSVLFTADFDKLLGTVIFNA